MKRIIEKYKSWSWETRLLVVLAALSLLPGLAALWEAEAPAPAGGQDASLDTHIPRGFVLIPIEIQNYEALDAVFGRFGLVDLFRAGESGTGHQPVAVNVRLLRAPHNPTRFAVLVPERQSRQILAHGGSYVAVVKPPGGPGTEFVKIKPKPRRKIVYGGS